MRILIFTTVFFPAIGGIENHTLLLIKNFIKKGHQVKVITAQPQTTPLKHIDVYYRPGFLKSIQLFNWCTTFYMPNISLKGIWLLLFNPKKTWVVSHNDFSSCNQKGFLPALKNTANKFTTKNIVVSKSLARYFTSKATVVHNCYDEDIFKLYPDEVRSIDFVFVGRIVTQKGGDLLIRACAALQRPFSLYIIGDGPEKANLMALTENLGLRDSITFTGFLKEEQLARTLNRCRVMVIPSLEGEGFGIVVLEGLACGCKIIAADTGGLAEAVGNYGKLFSVGSPEELSKLLNDELHHIDKKEINYSTLSQYLNQHSISKVSNNYLQYFT